MLQCPVVVATGSIPGGIGLIIVGTLVLAGFRPIGEFVANSVRQGSRPLALGRWYDTWSRFVVFVIGLFVLGLGIYTLT